MCSSQVLEKTRISSKYTKICVLGRLEKRRGSGPGICIGKSEGHDQILITSDGGVECRLPLVPFSDADKMVNFVKTVAPCRSSKANEIRGRG